MPANDYFCGYRQDWMDRFFQGKRPKGIADAQLYLYAEALCHLYRTKKSTRFKFTHTIMDRFHLNRNTVKRYLRYLQDIGIIEFNAKPGSLTNITLLHVPPDKNNSKKEEFDMGRFSVPIP